MDHHALIDRYLAGAEQARESVAGMTDELLDARPVAGKWSTRQVVCHLADFEPIYADRMKRVIAEQTPTFFGGDPDTFAAGLRYDHRQVEAELGLIAAVRRHMAAILRELRPADFERRGIHSEIGPVSLEQLLINIVDHVPHHVHFIEQKRRRLGLP